jgi:hypothetical protein
VGISARPDGIVTLSRSYKPFGETLSSQGYGQSSFGYTGEDGSNGVKDLLFLSARNMAICNSNCKMRDMNIRLAEIIILNKKVFVPSMILHQSKVFSITEPVYVLNPFLSELVPVIRAILTTTPQITSDPEQSEVEKRQKFLLTKTGERNQKILHKEGICYMIELSEKGILLMKSDVDSKGRWVFNPKNDIYYSLTTDLSVVVQALLDDYFRRI